MPPTLPLTFTPFTTPRVLVGDNGAEYRNALVAEISAPFPITQTLTAAYLPASSGSVESANKMVLDIIPPLVNGLSAIWDDGLP